MRSRNKYKPRAVQTPKAQRVRLAVAPVRPLVDPVRTLGHAARPRRKR